MFKHITGIIVIFIGVSIAWMILGGSMESRTFRQDVVLRDEVGQLWGTPQEQKSPQIFWRETRTVPVEIKQGENTRTEMRTETHDHIWPLNASEVQADLKLDHRQKGLLWYSTYGVAFNGRYQVVNNTEETRRMFIDFSFPDPNAVYDDFKFVIGQEVIEDVEINEGRLRVPFTMEAGHSDWIHIAYRSQGLDDWWYSFGDNVSQVKNFSLNMTTNFDQIDFPANSISPTEKVKGDQGWKLSWNYSNLLTGVKIGMSMPEKLNPGPWVASVTFFAPISLFLFLFMVFIFSVMQNVRIHPMNYFFISAAYFSFHLLLAYMVDHFSIHWSFLICSLVSIVLVVSYMRLVVGARFAFLQVGLSQFVFLVLFSYTFFFKGFTGLSVVVLCILTLFVAMQLTARVDWEQVFAGRSLNENPDQAIF